MNEHVSKVIPFASQDDDDNEPWLWNHCFDDWQGLDPATLDPRYWVYGGHYLRGAVSATIADGGVGKSNLALTEAIAIATGKPLLGVVPNKELWNGEEVARQVLYYNAEESLDEIKRRVLAICQHCDLDRSLLGRHNGREPPLTVISGHDFPLVLATIDDGHVAFSKDIEFLECYEGDAIILDPFVSIHQCPENDNTAIDAVVKRLARAAMSTPHKSIELVHHSRKPAQGGNVEISAADARGASALGDGVRSLRMLNRMTAAEAARAKVEDHRGYFRLDNGKTNYAAPSSGSEWFRHVSVLLPNGDDVGVIVPWHFPGAFDGVSAAHMQAVRDLARGGKYRADPRADEWIGSAVADVLNLDIENEGDRKRIKTILREWYAKGVIKRTESRDQDSRKRFVFVEPGEWTDA